MKKSVAMSSQPRGLHCPTWLSGALLLVLVLFSLQFEPIRTFHEGVTDPNVDTGQCFCKLEGQIDDCLCSVDTVDYFNNMKIFPRLHSLLRKDYFRYFMYNANKGCPFWNNTDGLCKNAYCGVKACTREELPPGLKGGQDKEEDCNDKVDSTISESARKDLQSWRDYDDAQSRFCDVDAEHCPDCDYVDLAINPERFTGYSGEASRRIWRAIYEENCFRPPNASKKDRFSAAFLPDTLENMCLEKRAFYRAVSGLHTSITVHLTAQYPKNNANSGGGGGQPSGPFASAVMQEEKYGPNLDEFLKRFDPVTTKGQGPYWLKNLYFVYLLELRALTKVAPYLEQQAFYTGNTQEDKETVIAVKELLNLLRSFPDQFDETSMFNSGQELALKQEFRDHFRNISRVMDCVGCDKCKLWGKLQITGLGTALKILFAYDTPEMIKRKSQQQQDFVDISSSSSGAYSSLRLNSSDAAGPDIFHLSRNEVVALFNAFGRISTSIQQLEKFRQMMR